jgi:hypothetical protein
MDAVDVMVFALLALADICLIIHLRRRRARILRVRRMYHTLALAVRRELAEEMLVPKRRNKLVARRREVAPQFNS